MSEVEIILPTMHAGQAQVYADRSARNAIRCGRRWGKTTMAATLGADMAIPGGKVGFFAPTFRQWQEPYDEMLSILAPIVSSSNRMAGVIKLKTGGKIDFWHLIDNELAGRGREYDLILIDEAAYTKTPQMMDIWQKSILPTMATRPDASVWLFSTPSGVDRENFFYRACNDDDLGFKRFWAPSDANPMVNRGWLAAERLKSHPDVYRQEYLAEFVDWSGTAFLSEDKLLVDGAPVEAPVPVDYVFATIDTAVKTGSKNDGTAVVFFAMNRFLPVPLYVLDWDITQIEGALLEAWLPSIFQRLEAYARSLGARHGSLGAYIEDKASGSILVQQALRHGWPVEGIDAKLTALGKDERSINVSGYHYQGLCKITREAYDKVIPYKGASRNHFLAQVCGFRIGVKDQADDLLDCYTYGLAAALGDGNWH